MEGEKVYDLLVLGGGPAGLTAAIYSSRYDMKTLVVSKDFGGTANLAGEVENWPGFVGAGIELMQKFKEQAESFGTEFLSGVVDRVERDGELFCINVNGEEIKGKTLLIALGTEHRQLGIQGEKKFLGKGVSYCATCDGNFFKGKRVAVVGGADSAAKAALYLSGICEKVNVIYRRHEMRCEPISLKRIKDKENIEVFYHSNPTEILGEGKVQKIKILTEEPEKDKVEREIDVEGVFIEIGATPATEVIEGLGLELDGKYIVVDRDAKTNVEGVFAAGDVTDNSLKQIVTSAAEGAIAAKSAHEYLMGKG